MTAPPAASPLFAGIDWASKTHMICVVDQLGDIRARFEIVNTGKTFTGLVRRLTKLGVAGVAIERCDGPLVEALLDADLPENTALPRIEIDPDTFAVRIDGELVEESPATELPMAQRYMLF